MFSKDDAEKKLFDVFFDVGLDRISGKKPSKASIEIFEEQNENEHNWRLTDDKIIIFMSAKNFEEGTRYVSGNFATQGVFNDKRDKFVKYYYLFYLGFLLETLCIIPLPVILKNLSIFAGIISAIIGIGVFLTYLILTIRWKKRCEEHLNKVFQKIGFTYSAKEQRKFIGLIAKYVFLILLFIFSSFFHTLSVIYFLSTF